MKITLLLIISTGLVLFLNETNYAQQDLLNEMLQGKTKFVEITQAYEDYFTIAPDSPEKEKLRKQFARWAWYMSFHLGPEGEFVNIPEKTLEAVAAMPAIPPARSANGTWNFTGPHSTFLNNPEAVGLGNGRADRIAFHPTNSGIIYTGTPAGGLWKTTNGGTSWTSISGFIPSLGISGIVVSHADANTIYLLTGDGDSFNPGGFVNELGYIRSSAGVMVSYDGGVNWQMTGPLASSDYVGYCLVQHPNNANILLAGTSDGIYRTTDGGNIWTQVYANTICDIEFKPGNPTILYASGFHLYIKSTNTGVNWSGYYSGYPDSRIELAVTPAAPENVYMLCAPKLTGNTFYGFFRSTNSGESFTELCDSPNVFGDENGVGDQSNYDITLTVKPNNAQIILIGGLIVYKSTNGGTTFTPATTYWETGGNYIHPDIHCLAYNPLNNYLYAAGDGGFHRSTNDGGTWTDYYTGLNTSQFYHLDDYNANQYTILAGCQDNGVKFRSSSTTQFSHISSGDGFDGVINYNNQYQGFVSINNIVRYYSHFTLNNPATVVISANNWFPQVELNVSNPEIMYYSYVNVYRYTLSTNTSTNLGGYGYWALKTCPSYVQRIYAAGGSSLYANYGTMHVTSNGGSTWSTISDNPGFPVTYPPIKDIGVNPLNSVAVYVCFGGYTDTLKVLYSSTAGSSWTNITYDLPNVPMWSLEVDNNNNVYVGTDIGIYYKASGATVWEPFYNNLPNVPVSDLAINVGSDQLLAATFGRGIWSSTLRDPCPSALGITSNVTGQHFRSSSGTISMNADVVGGAGTYAILRAGNYVDLTEGFQVNGDVGNRFLAYNGPCDSGMPPDFTGQVPVFPNELKPYELRFSRHLGTLEVLLTESARKQLVLRLFNDGNVRIILADCFGKFISELVAFEGTADHYTFSFDTSNLEDGLYYIYLVVNDQVDHLQEMLLP